MSVRGGGCGMHHPTNCCVLSAHRAWGPSRWREMGEGKQQRDGRILPFQEMDLSVAPTWPRCKRTCIESSRIQATDSCYRALGPPLTWKKRGHQNTEENRISQGGASSGIARPEPPDLLEAKFCVCSPRAMLLPKNHQYHSRRTFP